MKADLYLRPHERRRERLVDDVMVAAAWLAVALVTLGPALVLLWCVGGR